MCGIAGFIGTGELGVLHRMIDALAHRGPDGEGIWIEQNSRVFLGHRRLSILDIAAGSQPMTTIDEQLVVIFNGEIYNHAELRAQLETRGHRFKTDHSDTEVLLYGYREWGPSLLEKLNGMWSRLNAMTAIRSRPIPRGGKMDFSLHTKIPVSIRNL